MATIQVNGKSYETDSLSDEAKKILNAVRMADVAIRRAQAQVMIAQTAKNTYLKNFDNLVNK